MGSNNNMKNSGGPQGVGELWGNIVRQNKSGQSPMQPPPQEQSTGIGPSNPPEAGMPDTSQDAQSHVMPQTPIEGGMNRGPQMPRTVSNEEMQQMFLPKQGQGEYWTNKLGQGGVVGGQEQQNQSPMGMSPSILQQMFQKMNAGRQQQGNMMPNSQGQVNNNQGINPNQGQMGPGRGMFGKRFAQRGGSARPNYSLGTKPGFSQ